jgi:hypothetical protein
VFLGERDGKDLAFVERYYGSSQELERVESARAFVEKYPEVAHAISYLAGSSNQAVEKMYELYRRHSQAICSALTQIASVQLDALVRQNVPAHSLLGTALGRSCPEPHTQGISSASQNGFVSENQLIIDHSQFEVRQGKKSCFLGNTKDFHLLDRLIRARGQFVHLDTLIQDVWEGARVEKNTIQRTVSNIRRKLGKRFEGIRLDGTQKDHYKRVLPRR